MLNILLSLFLLCLSSTVAMSANTPVWERYAPYKNNIAIKNGNYAAFSTTRLIPFTVSVPTTINRVDGEVGTIGENGKLVEISIYDQTLTKVSTTGNRETPTGSFSLSFSVPHLSPGSYFLAFVTNSTVNTYASNTTVVGYSATATFPAPSTITSSGLTAVTGGMPALTLYGDPEAYAPGFANNTLPANVYVFGYDSSTQRPWGINTATGKVCYSTDAGATFTDVMSYPTMDSGEEMQDLLVLSSKVYILTSKLRLFRSSGITAGDTFTDISCPTTAGLRHTSALGRPYGFTGIFSNYIFIGEYSATGAEFSPDGPRILRYDTVGSSWALSQEFAGARHIHAFYNAGAALYASIGDAGYSNIGIWRLTAGGIGTGAGGSDTWTAWTSPTSPHTANYPVDIIADGGTQFTGIMGASDVVGYHVLFSKTAGSAGYFELSPLIHAPTNKPSGETARSIIEDLTTGNVYFWTGETSAPALYVTFPPYVQEKKLYDLTQTPPIFLGRSVIAGGYLMNYNQRYTIPSTVFKLPLRPNEQPIDDVLIRGNTTTQSVSIGTTIPPFSKLQVDGSIYIGTTISSHTDGYSIGSSGNLMVSGKMEVDGTVYLDGLVYDSSLYGASAGVGAGKQLWISADGKLYAP